MDDILKENEELKEENKKLKAALEDSITKEELNQFLYEDEIEELKGVKATIIVRNLADHINQLTAKIQELEG